MDLLLDIFGFVSVLLSGVMRTAQCLTLGGISFLALIAMPMGGVDRTSDHVLQRSRIWTRRFAWALLATVAALLATHVTILSGTTGIPLDEAFGGDYARAQIMRLVSGALLVALLYRPNLSAGLLIVLGLIDLGAGVATSHAMARVDDRALLIGITAMHHLGAAVWIGGLPCFLSALRNVPAGEFRRAIASRYSLMCMIAVAAIAFSGIGMLIHYVGSVEGMYGTAYGMMLGTKIVLFFSILFLGACNFFVVRRLGNNLHGSIIRLRRFAEVELGIGITLLFVAASMTSLPPAIDLTEGRASLTEILERLTPKVPSIHSPSRDSLAFYQVESELAKEKAANKPATLQAYVPGAGQPLPRNAEDIAWSEYNHHISGLIVLIMGILVLLEKTGKAPWARHWPLMLIVLAVILFTRSEAEGWPFGKLGLGASLRDPEFIQHKAFMVLMFSFAGFEWSVRNKVLGNDWAKYVFPLLSAVGGMMLLTHSHSIANVKELLLLEMTHMPLAVFAIWSGWARWLDLRLEDGTGKVVAGWLWPIFFCLTAITLLLYREI
jgi:copper resistance protein D